MTLWLWIFGSVLVVVTVGSIYDVLKKRLYNKNGRQQITNTGQPNHMEMRQNPHPNVIYVIPSNEQQLPITHPTPHTLQPTTAIPQTNSNSNPQTIDRNSDDQPPSYDEAVTQQSNQPQQPTTIQ